MKKKFYLLSLITFMIFVLSSCSNRITLLFLNWGEYVDESILEAFEDKYNCNVSMDLGESNEIFYSKVLAGTTVYDVVCPSDYMVMKMYQKDKIEKIDFSRLKNYDGATDVREGVLSIREDMIAGTDDNITDYYVPYLWGTWGIMYDTKEDGLQEAVEGKKARTDGKNSQWQSLFDRNSLPGGMKVAMYDSHQHAYYAACRYLGYDPHQELETSKLNEIKKLVKEMKYNSWGTDLIKKNIVAGNLDLGFMWTGDFLYYYAEQAADRVIRAYLDGKITADEVGDMIAEITDSNDRVYKDLNKYEIGFDIFIPDDTIAFCDNLVVVKDKSRSSAKEDLIYKFIDFMCSSEGIKIREDIPDDSEDAEDNIVYPANTNTQFVCYDTPFESIYDEILGLKDSEETLDYLSEKALEDLKKTAKSSDPDSYNDSDPYWAAYNSVLAIAFEKYYPKNGKVGSILGCFDRHYVNEINTTFNNARA